MLSSTAQSSLPLRFNGFSQNSLFVSIKNIEQKQQPIEKMEQPTFSGKENVDSISTMRPNYCLEVIKRHLQNNPNAFQKPSQQPKKRTWSAFEDAKLINFVDKFGEHRWNKVSKCMNARSEIQCFNRWLELKNDTFVSKGPWTKEEDEILRQMVNSQGARNWSTIAGSLPGRIGKQCRERWHNHLDPNIRKEKWTAEEDKIILKMHASHGNKWCEIAKSLPGRTDNAIKNRFNSKLKKYASQKIHLLALLGDTHQNENQQQQEQLLRKRDKKAVVKVLQSNNDFKLRYETAKKTSLMDSPSLQSTNSTTLSNESVTKSFSEKAINLQPKRLSFDSRECDHHLNQDSLLSTISSQSLKRELKVFENVQLLAKRICFNKFISIPQFEASNYSLNQTNEVSSEELIKRLLSGIQ